jgi:hypothetical protein
LIDLCKFLIDYCNRFKPEFRPIRHEEKPQPLLEESAIKDKQWEKELKMGASILVGKKNNLDEDNNDKKNKKMKRKNL